MKLCLKRLSQVIEMKNEIKKQQKLKLSCRFFHEAILMYIFLAYTNKLHTTICNYPMQIEIRQVARPQKKKSKVKAKIQSGSKIHIHRKAKSA